MWLGGRVTDRTDHTLQLSMATPYNRGVNSKGRNTRGGRIYGQQERKTHKRQSNSQPHEQTQRGHGTRDKTGVWSTRRGDSKRQQNVTASSQKKSMNCCTVYSPITFFFAQSVCVCVCVCCAIMHSPPKSISAHALNRNWYLSQFSLIFNSVCNHALC